MQSSGPNYGSYALNLTVVRFSSRTCEESRSYFSLSCYNCSTDRQLTCAMVSTYFVCVSFLCNTETSCSGLFESHLTLRQLPFLIIVNVQYSSQKLHSEFQPRRTFALSSSFSHQYFLIITFLGTEAVFSAPPSPLANDGTR